MARRKVRKQKQTKLKQLHAPKWFSRRSVVLIFAFAIACATTVFAGELRGLLFGARDTSAPGWIIDGNQLQDLIAYSPSNLPKTYFDTADTFVLKAGASSKSYIPRGWQSQAGNHYTSFNGNGCGRGCYSFMKDVSSGKLSSGTKPPIALYDNESWFRTPKIEQRNPCDYMSKFVTGAHGQRLTTIVAPDQDLAEPGLITSYQGGESENWQTYLRLGLGTCAAQTGSQWYHVMSQPFESHWCGNPLGKCQSSESDFVNFVTQAALQAKAINPNLKISDGLSTSPKYFGNFRGAETFAKIMYRDYSDVRNVINAVWLNIVGPNANTTALYFLSMLGKHPQTQRRSSVLFLQNDDSLQNRQPGGNTASQFSLNDKNSSRTFISKQTLAAGTGLPAGTGEFQFWTDGKAGDFARIVVNFGYCKGNNCSEQKTVKRLSFRVHGGAKGATAPGGAFTTSSDTKLPTGTGPYHLFVQLSVENSAPINLLFGSNSTPTNLATPILLPL